MTSHLNADLHCHSVVSDGTLTPEALAARAHANGVALWALTDHDEIGGQQRALAAARSEGMKYLTGTEISVSFAGHTVHIVGLGFDADNADLKRGLAQTRGGRGERAMEMSDGLAKVVSKRELLTEVWKQAYGGGEHSVDVHVSWLRRKLGETAAAPVYIHSIRHVGVRLAAPEITPAER